MMGSSYTYHSKTGVVFQPFIPIYLAVLQDYAMVLPSENTSRIYMEIEKITIDQSRITFQDTDESLAVAYAVAEQTRQKRLFQLPKAARKLTETISMTGIDDPENLSVDLSNHDATFVVEALKNFSKKSSDQDTSKFHYAGSENFVPTVDAIVETLPAAEE